MKTKKIIIGLLTASVVVGMFNGCGSKKESIKSTDTSASTSDSAKEKNVDKTDRPSEEIAKDIQSGDWSTVKGLLDTDVKASNSNGSNESRKENKSNPKISTKYDTACVEEAMEVYELNQKTKKVDRTVELNLAQKDTIKEFHKARYKNLQQYVGKYARIECSFREFMGEGVVRPGELPKYGVKLIAYVNDEEEVYHIPMEFSMDYTDKTTLEHVFKKDDTITVEGVLRIYDGEISMERARFIQ